MGAGLGSARVCSTTRAWIIYGGALCYRHLHELFDHSRDELDELFSDAVREEQIERKLSLLEEQWSSETLTLGDHKGRAACILKVRRMWNGMASTRAC